MHREGPERQVAKGQRRKEPGPVRFFAHLGVLRGSPPFAVLSSLLSSASVRCSPCPSYALTAAARPTLRHIRRLRAGFRLVVVGDRAFDHGAFG